MICKVVGLQRYVPPQIGNVEAKSNQSLLLSNEMLPEKIAVGKRSERNRKATWVLETDVG